MRSTDVSDPDRRAPWASGRYCPYTAAPEPDGRLEGPRLMRARRLWQLRASRHDGDGLDLPGFWEPADHGDAVLTRSHSSATGRDALMRAEGLNAYSAKALNKNAGSAGRHFRLVGPPPDRRGLLRVSVSHPQPGPHNALPLRPAGERTDRAGVESRRHRPGSRGGAVGEDRAQHRQPGAVGAPVHPPLVSIRRIRARRELPGNPEVGILFDQLWVR